MNLQQDSKEAEDDLLMLMMLPMQAVMPADEGKGASGGKGIAAPQPLPCGLDDKALMCELMEAQEDEDDADQDYLDVALPAHLADQHGTSAEQRASHACAWLSSMYEPQENVSMPRSALYDHYLEACSLVNQDPVNSATFGKLLRAVFPLLKTRRLGTRGNSKYHYYGIGIKAEQLQSVPVQYSAQLRTTPPNAGKSGGGGGGGTGFLMGCHKKKMRVSNASLGHTPSMSRKHSTHHHHPHHHPHPHHGGREERPPTGMLRNNRLRPFQDLPDFGRYLEQLCAPNPAALPLHIPYEHLQYFAASYHRLLVDKAVLVSQLNLGQLEHVERAFWSSFYHRPDGTADGPIECMQTEEVSRIVTAADDYFHSYVTVSLFPSVCEPLPYATLQAVRHFAKSHEQSMAGLLPPSLPLQVVEGKLQAARKFAMGLRRRTSMGHLAQAVRAVLEGQPEMVKQMRTDWLHLDLGSAREQLQWVFRVSDSYCSGLEQGINELLARQAPLDAWLAWVEGCAEQCLAAASSSSSSAGSNLEEAGRSLVLRWSLFTSLLLRDLTLKGGHSFGSFHLLRLLLDEYVMFYVERRCEEAGRANGIHMADHQRHESVDCDDDHPGIRQDVLLTPSKQQRWQCVVSDESL